MRVPETRAAVPLEVPADSALRRRALLVSGMGFFTDAYDLFVIGIVTTLLKTQWHLGTGQVALLNAVMLGRRSSVRWCSAGSPTTSAAPGCTGCPRR